MIPNFIGIGGQRCGTTWLHDVLSEHPSIITAHTKELHFFSYYYHFGYEWYVNQFEKIASNNICGEYSTSYLYDSQAPERVKLFNPGMKLIVCIRNPIDRAISHHRHEIQGNRISKNKWKFHQALNNNPCYLVYGCYFKALENWFKYFSKDQIHVILFEDIINYPENVIMGIYEYLGVDKTYKPLITNKKIYQSRIPKSIMLSKVQSSIAKVLRLVGLGRMLDEIKNVGIKSITDNLNTDSAKRLDYLSDDINDYLVEFFREDIKKLSKLLDIDLYEMWLQ